MLDYSLSLIISLLILLQAYWLKRLVGTWMVPGCIWGLIWFLATFIPILMVHDIAIYPGAMLVIFICSITVSATALIFDWPTILKRRHERHHNSQETISITAVDFYVIFLTTVSLGVVNWGMRGVTVTDLIFNLMTTANEMLQKRYSQELEVGLVTKFFVAFNYALSIVGGIVFSKSSKARGRIIIFSMLPSIAMVLIDANKGTIPLAITLFLGGVFVDRLRSGRLSAFAWMSWRYVALSIAILAGLFTVAMLARGIFSEQDQSIVLSTLRQYFSSYIAGHLFAFSDWFQSYVGNASKMDYHDNNGSGGFFTFMSVFRIFGDNRVVPEGTYDEYFYIDGVLQTNIFTIYRGLIMDFGIIGCVVVVALIGFFMHRVFQAILANRNPTLSIALYPHILGFIQQSIYISALIYNSFYISTIIVFLVQVYKYRNNSESGTLIWREA